MELQKDVIGKKIVFIHPPELVSKHLLNLLTQKEYEVYTLMDHSKVKWVQTSYPGSLFFLNIDAVLKEFEWQEFIRKLRQEHPELQLGIFSFKISEPARIQFYVLELGISCGFIQMKQGVKSAADMMLKILEVNEVKGRRKYIRYQCSNEMAVLNFRLFEQQVKGVIQDISSVGMSFFLDSPAALVKNQVIKDIQLKLKGIIVGSDGVVLGQRSIDNRTLYVILFNSPDQKKVREKIHAYIYTAMQKEFDQEFSTGP